MEASLISKISGNKFLIEIDYDLLCMLTPDTVKVLENKTGKIQLYDYVKNASDYHFKLKEFKEAIGILLKLSTNI